MDLSTDINEIYENIKTMDKKIPSLNIIIMHNAIWYSGYYETIPEYEKYILWYYRNFMINKISYLMKQPKIIVYFNYEDFDVKIIKKIFKSEIIHSLVKVGEVPLFELICKHRPKLEEDIPYYIYMINRFIEEYMIITNYNKLSFNIYQEQLHEKYFYVNKLINLINETINDEKKIIKNKTHPEIVKNMKIIIKDYELILQKLLDEKTHMVCNTNDIIIEL